MNKTDKEINDIEAIKVITKIDSLLARPETYPGAWDACGLKDFIHDMCLSFLWGNQFDDEQLAIASEYKISISLEKVHPYSGILGTEEHVFLVSTRFGSYRESISLIPDYKIKAGVLGK